MGPAALLGAAALGAGALWRLTAAGRAERAVARRLPLGADGIVAGAGPIALDGDPSRAALLVHGFGDTPESLAYLAARLHAAGWTVRVPLLPGHGRGARAFAESRADQWLDAARDALGALRAAHPTVALVGQSMGGALATVLAAEWPEAPALVLLAPYLAPTPDVAFAARWHAPLGACLPYLGADGGARSIHDPAARASALGTGVVTPRLVHELTRVVAWAQGALPRVRAPARTILSRHDHRARPALVAPQVARLGSTERDVAWLEGCGHVIAADRERDRVAALTEDWLGRHARVAATW